MATTSHGHHIPGTSTSNDRNDIEKVRCGGITFCAACKVEASSVTIDFNSLEVHVKKVTKKPVTVEAVHWTKDVTMSVLIEFTNHLVRLDDVNENFKVYDRLHNEWIPFEYGDWIIKGVKGEFYPCAGDVFKETYEEEPLNITDREGGEEWVDVHPS